MYLFSRRTRISPGHMRDAMTWAVGITEQVNRITGIRVALYTRVFSPEVGSIAWAAFVPDLAMLETANDKLMTDDTYVTGVDTGAMMTVGGADDGLYQVVHGEPDPDRSIEYVTTVESVCANGAFARGLEVGVECARLAESITGVPTLFTAGTTGSYGSVAWFSGFEDIESMERSQAALAADKRWTELIDDQASKVYVSDPGATRSLCYRRVV